MKLSALMIAAAATALAPAALPAAQAQTTSNTTSSTTVTSVRGGRAVSVTTNGSDANAPNAAPQTAQPAGTASGATANTTGAGDMAGPTSGGAFRPLPAASGQDIVATLQASGEFGTFLKIADATSLTQVLKTTPGITVFAPTDAAFAAMPPASMDLKDPATLQSLQKLLTYHIVNTKIPPLAGKGAAQVATVATTKVTLDGSGPNVKINDANALQAQVTASNGVIYPIDKVLSPDYVPPPTATTSTTDQNTNTTTTTTSTKKSKKRHSS